MNHEDSVHLMVNEMIQRV